jgi:hypothetical protein
VLAINDLGLRPLPPQRAKDHHELIHERWERKPIIITRGFLYA